MPRLPARFEAGDGDVGASERPTGDGTTTLTVSYAIRGGATYTRELVVAADSWRSPIPNDTFGTRRLRESACAAAFRALEGDLPTRTP